MSDWIGRTVSKVEIERVLGKGGMAEVFYGMHTTLKRPVAVKVIHSHLADDQELLTRFSDEAQQVAALRHPNIVQVLDYDVAEDNSPYMVMEYLEGMALSDYLKALHKSGTTLPHEVIANLMQGIAQALDYAHQRGIIHRDIKPANVMLRAEPGTIEEGKPLPDDVQPVLTDFGVARMQNVTAARTATGALIGTPTYMSPEQVQGLPVDARTDVYALGVMLYEMLAGKTPFDPGTDTPASILFKQVLEPLPPLEKVDPEIEAVVNKATAKDPGERFQKAGDLAVALKKALGMEVAEGTMVRSGDALSEMGTHFSISTQPMKIPIVGERQFTLNLPFALTPGRLAAISGAAGALVLIVVLALVGVFGGRSPEEATSPEEAAPTAAESEEAAGEPAPAEEARQAGAEITAATAGDVEQLSQFVGAPDGAYAMRIAPDGERLAVLGFDGTVHVFGVESGSEEYALEGGHSGIGHGLAFSPDGSLLASGAEDFRLFMWDLESQTSLYSLVADTVPWEMTFTPDGSKLVYVGPNSSRVFIIDADGNEAGLITEHGVVLGSVDVSADGEYIASGNARGNVVISKLSSLATETTLNDGTGNLNSIKFSPDGAWLAAGSGSGDIWLWNTTTWELERTWLGHNGGVQYLDWSPDSSLLVSVGTNGSVILWNPTNGRELNSFQFSDGGVWKVDFAPDGSYFATVGGTGGMVRLFGLE